MNKLLSKLQIEQYENDGYVVPDFKMPEDILNKIEERHDELLKKHPEFKNYCPAILHYDESFLEFCKNESKNALSMRVFERGVGETEACGSGACAAVVSGILNGFLSANELIEVKMREGSLFVKWDGDLLSPVLLSGPATTVFDGEFYV